jgi:hypothetical protein
VVVKKSAKRREVRQRYPGERRPKSYLPAHNHVGHVPGFVNGQNGFRYFWIPPQWAGRGWSKCPCGWRARSWGNTHYARTEHAKHWRELIKKHGSLEAAQLAELRWLRRDKSVEVVTEAQRAAARARR